MTYLTTTRRSCLVLALASALLVSFVGLAHADHIVAIEHGGVAERYTPGVGWSAVTIPVRPPIDGIAYDRSHRAYVVSVGAPERCSFVEFTGAHVIARMSQAQFRRAAHTEFTANCELHQDPAGGVLVSASAGTLGSEMSWSVNVVSRHASLLGYGYAATSDGRRVALVQHTYFPAPELGSEELLAAGQRARPKALHLIVPLSRSYAYTDPALSVSGQRFAAVRTGSVTSSLVVGRLGGHLRPLRRVSKDTVVFDLQWLDSSKDLVALSGRGVGPSGTLSLIDPRTGGQRTLATAVTSFAVAP